MNTPLYGFPKKTAQTLVKMARERESLPFSSTTIQPPTPTFPSLRAYLVQPKTSIPGVNKNGKFNVQSGIGYILERVKEESSGEAVGDIRYRRNDAGEKVEVNLFNLCETSVLGTTNNIEENAPSICSLVIALQDTFGDLYIIEVCNFNCSSGSDSTSQDCYISHIDGKRIENVPSKQGNEIVSVLALTSDGCLVKVPVTVCSTGSS